MKTKEEILRGYYSEGADGIPEISADGLLKAMEEYREQSEEAAFNAGRRCLDAKPGGTYEFENFQDYKISLIAPIPTTLEPSEAQAVQFVADSILEQFIPNDAGQKKLSFTIKTNGMEYSVNYEKNHPGYWHFSGYSRNG